MRFPTPPFSEPVTCKELAHYLPNRSPRWVADMCRERRFKTLPIGKPYLIPPTEANRILNHESDRNRTAANAAR